jgi:intracellular multiplication protein IcmQ
MNHILNDQQKAQVLEALNQTAGHDVWEKSNFLRVIGKQVAEVRDDFKQLLNPKTSSSERQDHLSAIADKESTPVFISLYCSKGSDLKNWERVLSTLPTQLTSRSIYTEETHVIELIKSKIHK